MVLSELIKNEKNCLIYDLDRETMWVVSNLTDGTREIISEKHPIHKKRL